MIKNRCVSWIFAAIIFSFIVMGSAIVASAETYSINWFGIQQRIYGNGNKINRVVIYLKDENDQNVVTNIVSDFKVTDPNGELMMLPALTVGDPYEYRSTSYDSYLGNWRSWGTVRYIDIYTNFTEPLIDGTYFLEVTTTNGQVLTAETHFTNRDYLPIVSSDSFEFVVDSSGNVVWTWDFQESFYSLEPLNNSSVRAYIRIDESDSMIILYSISTPLHMGRAFIPKEIVDEINNSGGDTLSCSMQVRENSGSNRASSNSLSFNTFPPIVDEPPNGDTDPIIINPDLSFSLENVIYNKSLTEEISLSADFKFFESQGGILLWKLDDVTIK